MSEIVDAAAGDRIALEIIATFEMMHCYPHPSQQPPYHPKGGHKGMRMAGWGDRQLRKNKKRVWGQDLAFFAPQNMRFSLKWVLMVR